MAFSAKRSGVLRAFVLLLFFASGYAALLYQTIWQRMLGFFSGVDVYSVTITVAAFMAGLGCGSLAGGQLADRLSERNRLLVFAVAEAIVALFALTSTRFYYEVLYLKWGTLGASPVLLPFVLFASLLVPTFCMGVTLPILAKTFTARIEAAPAIVGLFYGVNTLGAAAGALLTPWILLRHFSFPQILQLGAALNGICAVGAALVWLSASNRMPAVPAEELCEIESSDETGRFSVRVWMLVYGLSGFIALSLEIVWFRILGVIQKSTSFTFPTLLGIYLAGLGLGVIIGIPFARRVRRAAVGFLLLQSGITLYAVLGLSLLVHYVDRLAVFQRLYAYLGSFDPVDVGALFSSAPGLSADGRLVVTLYFVLPLALIAPATLLMGMSFPLLQKVVQSDPNRLGRRVASLQTINIVGSMMGALLVGGCFLGWFGTAGTLRLLVALGGLFPCFALWLITPRRSLRGFGIASAIVVVGAFVLAVHSPRRLWAKLHGTTPRAMIAHEGASGLSVIKGGPNGFADGGAWVFTNGSGQSWLPYGGAHTKIGMLGTLLHPRPEEVAIIGLGSGDTAYALGGSPHTRQITCIEIVEPGYESLKELATRFPYPPLLALLDDRRIRWSFTDGRACILRSAKRFDVIEADALRPNNAYAGNLYSWQYFQTLRAHLKPGGIAITWAPTGRVLTSLLKAFPFVLMVDGIAVGSEQPIVVEPEEIARRLADPFTTNYYGRINADLRSLIADLTAGKISRFSPESPPTPDLNSDLFPKDEYMVSSPP